MYRFYGLPRDCPMPNMAAALASLPKQSVAGYSRAARVGLALAKVGCSPKSTPLPANFRSSWKKRSNNLIQISNFQRRVSKIFQRHVAKDRLLWKSETLQATRSWPSRTLRLYTQSASTMDGKGGEKRKAEEMASDSVEVPLAELREVAEKAGREARMRAKYFCGCFAAPNSSC